MRRPLIVGNWKMNKTASEAGPFVWLLSDLVHSTDRVEVVLAPPFTAIHAAKQAMSPPPPFGLAAQDLFWEDKGAFTGEISAPMVRDLGCDYVILGHSERRQHFSERDDGINHKLHAALRHGLGPILCLGESLSEREAGQTDDVVLRQLTHGLEGLGKEEVRKVTIAYEPVWAIGTGRAASLAQAEAVHERLRETLIKTWGTEAAEGMRVLYGGSVTPANAGELLASPSIDGALVGGACLDAEAFARIIQSA